MKNWSDYFDPNGLLTQKGPTFDGGDTPSHEGFARVMSALGAKFPSPIQFEDFSSLLESGRGELIRNPVNYNNWLDTSRDQYRGFVIASTLINPDYMLPLFYEALPRNFLHWPHYPNGDVFSTVDYVMFDRLKKSYPMRLLADLLQLLGILVLVGWSTRNPGFLSRLLGKLWWPFIAMNPPNAEGVQGSLRGPSYTSDDLGATLLLVQSADQKPTFINKLARWTYSKFRPNGIQWAFSSYFGADQDPPVDTLTYVLSKYFNKL
jgi:hypothetical protein